MIWKRITVAALALLATLGLSGIVPATSTAAPGPALAIANNGESFWVNERGCRGDVRATLITDPAKPGRVTVRFKPTRFTRPCTVNVWSGWDLMGADQIRVPIRSGPRGGPAVYRTYRTGPGLHALSFGHRPSLSAVTYYAWIP
ncbi:hypothetical protein [Gordonia alkanivorans]|uniref:hypothetical protein n=1 Tax=Gordonia alkanivorans TaxID=84096 RepID=UPI0004AD101A|nr:hypothetical protein [Gordonia alkanivorans]